MKKLLSAVLLLGCSTSSASPPQDVAQPDMGAYCPTTTPISGVDVAVVPVPLALYEVAEPIELSALGVAGADEVEQDEIGRIAEIHSLAVGAEGDWTIAFHDLVEGAAWVDRCDLPRQRAVGAHFL